MNKLLPRQRLWPELPEQIVASRVFQWSMIIMVQPLFTIHPLFIPWFIHNSFICLGHINGLVSREKRNRKPSMFHRFSIDFRISVWAIFPSTNPLTLALGNKTHRMPPGIPTPRLWQPWRNWVRDIPAIFFFGTVWGVKLLEPGWGQEMSWPTRSGLEWFVTIDFYN